MLLYMSKSISLERSRVRYDRNHSDVDFLDVIALSAGRGVLT